MREYCFLCILRVQSSPDTQKADIMREYVIPQDTQELRLLIIKTKKQIRDMFAKSKKVRDNKEAYKVLSDDLIEHEAYLRDLYDELAARN